MPGRPLVFGADVTGAGELDGARHTALVEDLDDIGTRDSGRTSQHRHLEVVDRPLIQHETQSTSLAFGVPQQKPALGDVLIFWRGASSGFNGHVGLYVGEDAQAFHVLGGDQSDRVMIKRIAKNRLLGCRRCPWRINQPAAVRPVVLAANGALSTNEA